MILRPPRYTIKPASSVGMLRGSSLLRGLAGFIPLSEGGGKPRCWPRRFTGTLSGSTPPVWSPFGDGQVLKFTSTTRVASTVAYVDFGTPPDLQDLFLGTTPCTLMARVWNFPAGTRNSGIAERNDNNAVNIGWEWGMGAGNSLALAVEFSSTNLGAQSVGAVPSGKWVTVGVYFDGTGTPGNVKFYIDGRDAGNTPGNTGSGTRGTDSGRNFFLGRTSFNSTANNANSSWLGSISWFAAWRRKLNTAEISDLGAYPYLLWDHFDESIHAAPSAAAAPGAAAQPQIFCVS